MIEKDADIIIMNISEQLTIHFPKTDDSKHFIPYLIMEKDIVKHKGKILKEFVLPLMLFINETYQASLTTE